MGGQILLVVTEQTAFGMTSQMNREKGCVIASLRDSHLLPIHELWHAVLVLCPSHKASCAMRRSLMEGMVGSKCQ